MALHKHHFQQLVAAAWADGFLAYDEIADISKVLALPVAADPDFLSGKAKKARDYGIPSVGEDYLWNVLF